MPASVDRLTKFRNRKGMNGKILRNSDEMGMAQLVEKLELLGYKHIFVKPFPHYVFLLWWSSMQTLNFMGR